ncbi:putative F-box domain-containing protein [Helianthus annuus]|nr:putative F-box domain-containing protein [Helianthus annuus]
MLDMEDSDHQSIQSGAIIGSNDDHITEILLRLPAASILRFKSVSKHWRWLLRQKHFTQRYDNVSKSPTDPYQIQIQSYSSDARKWKISIQSFHLPVHFTHPGVYWNGAIYWAPYYGNSNCLYFKLDVQQLQRLPLPEGLMTSITIMYFGESRGHLHLIAYKNHSLSVYEMLSNHSGWFLKYQLLFDALRAALPGTISQVIVTPKPCLLFSKVLCWLKTLFINKWNFIYLQIFMFWPIWVKLEG